MKASDFMSVLMPIKDKLFRFALRLLGDREEAEDALQDVLAKLWQKRDKLEQYQNPEAAAMTAMRNHCIDMIRKRKMQKLELKEEILPEASDSPAKQTELNDAVNAVNEIIARLPEQQKMVIHLRDIEGLEFKEISNVTGLTENNIRVHLSRARKKIRELLITDYNYEYKPG
ncbi:MAG: RNA polymerase sigma factor [Bacteroidota bacterium]